MNIRVVSNNHFDKLVVFIMSVLVIILNGSLFHNDENELDYFDFSYIDFQESAPEFLREEVLNQKGFLDADGIKGQNYFEISTGKYYSSQPTKLSEIRYYNGRIEMLPWANVALLDDVFFGDNPLSEDVEKERWKNFCEIQKNDIFAAEATSLDGASGGIAVFKVTDITKKRVDYIYNYYPS